MECDLSEAASLTKLILGLLLNGGGVIFTLATLFLLFVCPDLDPQLRDVLVSYQLSNLVGCSLTTYETVSSSCRGFQLGLTGISLLLAISHFGILLICEYDDLTSNPRVFIEPLKGLIFFSWLIAVSFGALLPTTKNFDKEYHLDRTKAGLAVIAVIVLSFMYLFFSIVIRPKQHARDTYLYWQKFLFDCDHPTYIHTYIFTCWKTGYFHAMFLSYVCFTLPWLIEQLYEGFSHNKTPVHGDFAIHFVYSMNFYCPAIVCVLMWRNRQGKIEIPRVEVLEVVEGIINDDMEFSSREFENSGCSKNGGGSSLRGESTPVMRISTSLNE